MVKKMIYVLMLLIVIVVLIFIAVIKADQKTAEKKELAFRFEDYSHLKTFAETAEAVKNALLHLHPVGTSVNALLETLRKTDATCTLVSGVTEEGESTKYSHKLMYKCRLPAASILGYTLTMTAWTITIIQKNGVIQNIDVAAYYIGL